MVHYMKDKFQNSTLEKEHEDLKACSYNDKGSCCGHSRNVGEQGALSCQHMANVGHKKRVVWMDQASFEGEQLQCLDDNNEGKVFGFSDMGTSPCFCMQASFLVTQEVTRIARKFCIFTKRTVKKSTSIKF